MKRILLSAIATMVLSQIGWSQILMFDQTANSGSGSPAQIFDGGFTQYTSFMADDFEVPTGETWYIDSIKIFGTYSSSTDTAGIVLAVCEYNNGMPGDTIQADTVYRDVDFNGDGDLIMHYENSLVLTADTYFVAAAAMKQFTGGGGQYFWTRTTTGWGVDFLWQNPGNGFTSSCSSWVPGNTCAALGTSDDGAAFQVWGCPGMPPMITSGLTDTTFCTTPQTLSVTATGSNLVTIWNMSDTMATYSADTTDSFSFYRVDVIDTVTGCGAGSSANINFVILTPPALPDDEVCANSSTPATFAIPNNNCATCEATWPDGSSGPFYSTMTAGQVSVTLTDTVSGCSVQGTGGNVTVYPALLEIAEGDVHDLCLGDTLTLSTTQSLTSPIWLLGNLGIYNTQSVSATASFGLGGTVAVTGTDGDGCTVVDTAYITAHEPPVPVVTTSGAGEGTVDVKAENGFESYLWEDGSTGKTINVEENGAYYVTVTDANGCEGSNFGIVNSVGIEDLLAAGFNLYPNPAVSEMHIQWPPTWVEGSTISVIDVTGRVLINENATTTTQTIDLSGLSSGQYLVQLNTPEGIKATTVVVAK